MGPAGTVHGSRSATGPGSPRTTSEGSVGGVPGCSGPRPSRPCTRPGAGEDYAGGWMVALERSWAGGRAFMHNGSNTLWYCTIWLAPALDSAFLVATNAAGKPAEQACDQAVQGLVRLATLGARNGSR